MVLGVFCSLVIWFFGPALVDLVFMQAGSFLWGDVPLGISRSGYTTMMEMAELDKKHGLFTPTPGQTEQEYLSRYYAREGWFLSRSQYKLRLAEDVQEAAGRRLIDIGSPGKGVTLGELAGQRDQHVQPRLPRGLHVARQPDLLAHRVDRQRDEQDREDQAAERGEEQLEEGAEEDERTAPSHAGAGVVRDRADERVADRVLLVENRRFTAYEGGFAEFWRDLGSGLGVGRVESVVADGSEVGPRLRLEQPPAGRGRLTAPPVPSASRGDSAAGGW